MLLNFLIGGLVSFLGSLPLGVLNLTAMQISLQRGMRAAWQFAWACAWVEFVYAGIAVWLTQTLLKISWMQQVFEAVSVVTFVVLGVYYLRSQAMHKDAFRETGAFWLGTMLSIVNMIAIPFWLIYTTFLLNQHWIVLQTQMQVLGYIIGISTGTLGAIVCFAAAGKTIAQKLLLQQRQINRLIGWTMLAAGGYQLVRIWV